jgi:hypothetical protein
MSEAEKPKRFVFHLSTAIAVSIATGFFVGLNVSGQSVETSVENMKAWGFPFGLYAEGLIKRGEERDCESLLNGSNQMRYVNGDCLETLVREPSGQISFKESVRSPKKYLHAGLDLAVGLLFCGSIASVSEWLIRRREARKTSVKTET